MVIVYYIARTVCSYLSEKIVFHFIINLYKQNVINLLFCDDSWWYALVISRLFISRVVKTNKDPKNKLDLEKGA